jgi:glutamine amidotransferase
MIGLIDYGSGNFASVYNALKTLTQDIEIIKNGKQLNTCSHIILPGVGSFGSAISKLNKLGLVDDLRDAVLSKKIPFLGICVGMQLLAEIGFEFGEHRGLGFIKSKVKKLDIDQEKFPLPHMGWNNLLNMENSPLFNGMDIEATFYFVHSFHLEIEEPSIKTVNVNYGKDFVAALSMGNIHGVQFHPEKSQYYGLKLLDNFIRL